MCHSPRLTIRLHLAEATQLDIGLVQDVELNELDSFADCWNYRSLRDPPSQRTSSPKTEGSSIRASGLYKGLVPAKSIERRDIAVNGTVVSLTPLASISSLYLTVPFPTQFSANNGYTFEVGAHWISAYFLGEDMRIPRSPAEARAATVEHLAWVRKRYSDCDILSNPAHASYIAYLWYVCLLVPTICCRALMFDLYPPSLSWPQHADGLLEDMHLTSRRRKGAALSWVFKRIVNEELRSLGAERRANRREEP